MTIGIIATFKIKADKIAEFEGVFATLAKAVLANEPGCLAYQLTRSRTDPTTYKVLELYKDQAAVTAHGGAEYFKTAFPKLSPTLDGTPNIEHLDGVG